jgi:DUF4097 and DUF4098 domain-containing protein YvlB
MNVRTMAAAAVAAALMAAPAAAQEQIDRRIPTGPGGVVEINNISGTVRVVGWDRNEVQVTGELGRGVERLDLSDEGGRVVVRVVLPRYGRNVDDSDLEIHVPAGKDVDVHTVSADATVNGVSGRTGVQTVSGEVQVDGSPREAQVQTVSGDVQISGVRGRVDVNTVSGDVRVDGRGIEAEVRTVSGDVTIAGQLDPSGTNQINTHSGDVTVTVARGGGASVEFGSFSGEVSSSVPGGMRMQGSTRSQHLEVGRGGPRILVHTFSGDLRLNEG